MKAAIVIPARFASIRLPGKALLARTGRPLVQHTYEQALQAGRASAVIVATDDRRIHDAVAAFGGRAVMTGKHGSGSARVAEAAATLDADIIVNLQGDEPEIDPAHIDRLIEIKENYDCFAATLACPFANNAASGPGSPDDPSAVKAILGGEIAPGVHRARYFTRTLCAWPRDAGGRIETPERYFLHVGIYAFSKQSLARFATAPQGALESAERLEQLRILEMGETIAVGLLDAAAPGIDTAEDYESFVRRRTQRR